MQSVNVRKLIQRFGGPAQLHRRLEKDGYKVTLRALHQWIRRGSVPGRWLSVLFIYADQEGRPLRLQDYATDGNKAENSRADMSFLD